MKLRQGLKLRQVGSRYMMVDACGVEVDMASVFSLNGVAARLWQEAAKGEFTARSLTDWVCAEYEVDEAEARKDVETLLEQWKEYGLADE